MAQNLDNKFILGIQIGHKSSVALYKNKDLLYYNQEERLSLIKRDSSLPIRCIDQIKNITNKIDVALVTGYDGGHFASSIRDYLLGQNLISKDKLVYFLHKTHHMTHAVKSYFSSGFKNALVFVVDGRGSSYNISNGGLGYETASVYHIKNNEQFKCIYKRIFTGEQNIKNVKIRTDIDYPHVESINVPSINKDTQVEIFNTHTLAHHYSSICNFFSWPEEEGKLMGLSAYGKPNKIVKDLLNKKDFILTPSFTVNKQKYPQIIDHMEDLAFETQQKFEEDYFKLIKKFIDKHPNTKNIILTGGTALNVVNNFKLLKKLKHYKIYIDPMCGDEGNSIGACQQFMYVTKQKFNPLRTIYLGPTYDLKLNLQNNEVKHVGINHIIKLLRDHNIIGIYQSKGEAGPRALGNRSFIMDPRVIKANDIMNDLKGREFFRPLACCVLEEHADKWFDIKPLKNSPYMMYAVPAKSKTKKLFPSIVHKDNTCRIQTISKKDNKFMYDLLQSFYKKTKVPILMNTSFNLKGKPLVEKPQHALDILKQCAGTNYFFKHIYFPETEELISTEDAAGVQEAAEEIQEVSYQK
jgi:carbamoyltransferase